MNLGLNGDSSLQQKKIGILGVSQFRPTARQLLMVSIPPLDRPVSGLFFLLGHPLYELEDGLVFGVLHTGTMKTDK